MNTAATATRKPIHMTAEECAERTYRAVVNNPENYLKTNAEIKEIAAHTMTRLIRAGLFVITN